MSPNGPFRVLALVPDLLTAMRIESGVQRLGGFLDVREEPSGFLMEIQATKPELALVDLSYQWLDLNEAVSVCMKAGVPIMAFGPHMDVVRLKQARQAGVDFVYPRSRLMGDVAGTLKEAIAGART
jgi:AmiR/NasT family two-component response regulator